MRILHLIDTFSNLTETFIYDTITELERQGVENHVFTFKRIHRVERPFDRVFESHHIRDIYWLFPRLTDMFRKHPISFWTRQRMVLKDYIRNIHPDAIHAHFGPLGVFAMPVAEKLGLPLVVSFYGYDVGELPRETYWRSQYEKLNKVTSYITCVSNYNREKLIEFFDSSKIHVIHIGKLFDFETIYNLKYPIRNFLSVGRLVEKKGHFDTIQAIRQVLDQGYDVRLKIIGEGCLHEELQRYVEKLGLSGHVSLMGKMQNNAVISEMQKADAFILCSKQAKNGDIEGTPTVIIESLWLGLPVVSTLHSGIPEIVPEQGHCFLAPEGDVDAIARCIVRLIETPREELLKIIQAGKAHVEKAFNLNTETTKLLTLYKQAVYREK